MKFQAPDVCTAFYVQRHNKTEHFYVSFSFIWRVYMCECEWKHEGFGIYDDSNEMTHSENNMVAAQQQQIIIVYLFLTIYLIVQKATFVLPFSNLEFMGALVISTIIKSSFSLIYEHKCRWLFASICGLSGNKDRKKATQKKKKESERDITFWQWNRMLQSH